MKTLSIIIPVYNTELMFFERCLSSLEEASSEKFEVIIVDDGSDAAYLTELCAVVCRQEYDICLLTKANGGQNAARQYGLDRAAGEYILFLDSDDYVDPGSLNTAIRHLETNKPKVLAFNYDIVDLHGNVVKTCSLWHPGYTEMDISHGICRTNSLCLSFYDASVLRSLDFDLVQGPRIGEDLASAVSILIAVGEAHTLGVVLYHYVRRPTSISRTNTGERVDDIKVAFDIMLSNLRERSIPYRLEIEWIAILHVLAWGGLRAIKAYGADKKIEDSFFNWMMDRFPNWKTNPFLNSEPIAKSIWFRAVVGGQWGFAAVLVGLRNLQKRLVGFLSGDRCG